MQWEGGEESGNVEDRRGLRTGHAVGIGGVLVMIVGYYLGIDPRQLLSLLDQGGNQQTQSAPAEQAPGKHDEARKFLGTILRFTEKVWEAEFRKMGRVYEKPRLVIYEQEVDSGCGSASAAVGPFYCPADRIVYIDPSFFDELSAKLGGSKADFSKAYVIAHEIGHHVQVLLGFSAIVDEKRRTLSKTEFNRWSVRLELQADYLAGVWAHYGQEQFNFVEKGDLEEALKSANAIGDDKLQQKFAGRTSPQNYTHGTAAQRAKWYRKGFETGDMRQLKVIFELPYEQL